MQIGNHAFGQNAMGISRIGIGQYQNVANKGKEQSATSDVAKMLQRNMDSLEMSPQAQKMTAPESKTEKGNISAQEVSKENATNGTKNPEVTSQVPSATETLAALGYDMEQMNDTVTVKEEVVTERVIDDGVLVNPSETQKTDFLGRTSKDYIYNIFRDENQEGFLPMEEVLKKSIEEFQRIDASDVSDEDKAVAKEIIREAIQQGYGDKDFNLFVHNIHRDHSVSSSTLSEDYELALEKAKDVEERVNSSKNQLIDTILKHLEETDGATTLEEVISVANQEAKKNGTMSFEDTFDLYNGSGSFRVTAYEMLENSVEEVMAQGLDGIRNHDFQYASKELRESIEQWKATIVREEKPVEEMVEDSQPVVSVDSQNRSDVLKEAVQNEISAFLQETGNDITLEEMLLQARDTQHNADDELLDQVSDLVFQNNVGTMGS